MERREDVMIHALKTNKEYFKAAAAETKKFEIRKNDRPFSTGDYVALNEWDGEKYTGRCMLCKILYILNDEEYCKEGYITMALEPYAIKKRGTSQGLFGAPIRENIVYERY